MSSLPARPYVPNPKQDGSNLLSCRVQTGPCPSGCAECYYNRPGACYCDPDQPNTPTVEEAAGRIVRVNDCHDSNLERERAIAESECYGDRFFNTSIPVGAFPAPWVLTINPREEEAYHSPEDVRGGGAGLMFVRWRCSATNLDLLQPAIREWCSGAGVPLVLTFMAYYSAEPDESRAPAWLKAAACGPLYEHRKRIANEYWCATAGHMRAVLAWARAISISVTMCGTPTSHLCRDCRNCEAHYWIAKERMEVRLP